jgi:hypothetical protein
MSKATIQMCMSTTGFGPQALRGQPPSQGTVRPAHSPSTSTTYSSDTDAEMGGYLPAGYSHQGNSRRPVPRFDMNLKDLFSENETDKRSLSRISNQLGNMRPPPPPQIKQETRQMQPFATDLKISPQMRSHPSLSQHQAFAYAQPQAQQSLQSPSFPSSTALSPNLTQTPSSAIQSSPYQISNQLPYSSFAQNIASTYPDFGISDLDFLDSFPVQGAGGMGNAGDGAGVGGVQDLDLGFGMEFGDGTHDWSDGNGFEMLGGFFFGGASGGGGGGV